MKSLENSSIDTILTFDVAFPPEIVYLETKTRKNTQLFTQINKVSIFICPIVKYAEMQFNISRGVSFSSVIEKSLK
jgi:hypothetical protein